MYYSPSIPINTWVVPSPLVPYPSCTIRCSHGSPRGPAQSLRLQVTFQAGDQGAFTFDGHLLPRARKVNAKGLLLYYKIYSMMCMCMYIYIYTNIYIYTYLAREYVLLYVYNTYSVYALSIYVCLNLRQESTWKPSNILVDGSLVGSHKCGHLCHLGHVWSCPSTTTKRIVDG